MKNAIIGATMLVVMCLMSLIHMSITTKDIRQNELDKSVNYAAHTTMEQAKIEDKYKIETNDEMVAEFNQNLLSQITSDSEIEVRVHKADVKNGLLDVEAQATFKYPTGAEGIVTSRKAVIYENQMQGMEVVETFIMMDGPSFNKKLDAIKGTTTAIEFADYIPDLSELKINVDKWDVSEKQDGTIMAWLDGTKLMIACDGDIKAAKNCSYMFQDFKKVTSISFNKMFNSSDTTNMSYMFNNCNALATIDTNKLDVANITTLSYMFYNCLSLTTLDVSNFDTSKVTSMYSMFGYCLSLTTLDVSKWDTSKVTNMSDMFANCYKITTLNVSNFDTSNVTDMSWMFYDCLSLTILDVSNFDTSNVTDMSWMFYYCSSLTTLDASKWDTSNVTNMSQMFYYCSSLTTLDVSKWDTSNVIDMSWMFYNCSSLTTLNVSNFDTSKVTNMSQMFYYCSSLTTLDIDNWNVDKVTTMNNMFNVCPSQRPWWYLISSADVKNYGDHYTITVQARKSTINGNALYYMTFPTYSEKNGKDVIVNNKGTRNGDVVTYTVKAQDHKFASGIYRTEIYAYDYYGKYAKYSVPPQLIHYATKMTSGSKFNSKLSSIKDTTTSVEFVDKMPDLSKYTTGTTKWDVSEKQDGSIMAWLNGTALSIGSNSDINANEDCESMFQYFEKVTSIKFNDLFSTSNVTNMGYMFYGCSSLTTLNVSKWDTSKVTDMNRMFYDCSSLTTLDVSNFDTSNVTNMSSMFGYCSSLTTLDVSNFDTSNVTDMSRMFEGCSSLTTLDVSNFDTSKVTSMYDMFGYCSSLTTLDVSNFDTSNVTDMSWMFYNCAKLTTLDVSKWDTSKVTSMFWMFKGCSSLTTLDVSKWDTSKVTSMYDMFGYCSSLTTLDVSNFDTSNVTDMSWMFEGCSSLTTLDVSKWDIDKVTNMRYMFSGCPSQRPWWYLISSASVKADKGKYIITVNARDSKINGNALNYMEFHTWTEKGGQDDITKVKGTRNGDVATYTVDVKDHNNEFGSYITEIYAYDKQGKYAKYNIPKQEIVDFHPYLLSGSNFQSELSSIKNTTTSINFVKGIPDLSKYAMGTTKWDVSEKQDGSIMAWLDGTILSIGSNEEYVQANKKSSSMFKWFEKVTSIKFNDLFDTSNVTNMYSMFSGCSSLTTLDVSNFDTSKVTSMYSMFSGCSSLTILDVSNWNTSNVIDMGSMFDNCSSLTTLDVSNWNTSNVIDMSWMFSGCSSLTTLDVSNFDTSKVISMYSMFDNCSSLTTLDASKWDTSNVTDMRYMFWYCKLLTNLNLNNWDTSNVTDMNSLFYGCSSLTTLDVSNWDTSNVTDMNSLFYGCSSLTTLDVSKWDTSNVTDMRYMFWYCKLLTNLNLNNWNIDKVTDMRDMFYGCPAPLPWWYLISSVSVENRDSQYVVTVKARSVSMTGDTIDYMVFPTWTPANGQDDLVWIRGTKTGDTFTFTADKKDHNNETGLYYTHIYAYDTSGREAFYPLANQTMQSTAPQISNVRVVDTSDGYTVTITVKDYDIDVVNFPTWTDEGGQDDITWGSGTVSGNPQTGATVTYKVSKKDHNNASGNYITHIYAHDKDGNASSYAVPGHLVK